MTYILGLRALRKSGKDFVTNNVLVPEYGARAYTFADRMKENVLRDYAHYGITAKHLNDPELKDAPLTNMPVNPKEELPATICKTFRPNFPVIAGRHFWTPRMLVINEATSKRAADSLYWVTSVLEQVKKDSPRLAVFTDVRMPETEADNLRRAGGKIVNIFRPRELRGVSAEVDDPTEKAMSSYPFDMTWTNDRDVDHLKRQVEDAFSIWGWDLRSGSVHYPEISEVHL